MRVLRSRRSLPETPLKTLTHPPEPLTPQITDLLPKASSAASSSSSSSSSVIFNPCRRPSLRLTNISSLVTVSTEDGAVKRKRSSRVSDVNSSSVSREEPCLQLRSGARFSRRRLGTSFDLVKERDEEMALSFKEEGGSVDGAEGNAVIMRGEAESGFKIVESPPVLESIRDGKLVEDVEKESNKNRDAQHNSVQEGGYMSLRSGSRNLKRKIGDESDVSLLAIEDFDGFACRKVNGEEGVYSDWKCIVKYGDQMLGSVGGIEPEGSNRGNCEEMKMQDELVIEEDGLDSGMAEACFGTNGIDEKGSMQFFSNEDELVARNEIKIFSRQDRGVDASAVDAMIMVSSKTHDSLINPIPEKGLPRKMLSVDGLVCRTRSKRYSREEKGKEKLGHKTTEDIDKEKISAQEVQFDNANRLGKERSSSSKGKPISSNRREAGRKLAIELAPQFAFYKTDEEISEEDAKADDSLSDANDEEDWPGPFSTALKIIQERESMLRTRLYSSSQNDRATEVRIPWTPSNEHRPVNRGNLAPSLKDLCLNILFENAEEIESLEGLPDALKHMLALQLCCSRRMSSRVLGLLAKGSPSEIYVSECSWATEREFEEVFSQCNICSLKVLQLDFCGRCLPDYVLHSTLAKAPNCLPSLNRLSLKGAYCISDVGLEAIVASAPLLRSLNLSQCSLLTARGIIALAEKLEQVLQELYIDNCQNVDAMLILPALKKLKCLEVFSVAHMETVTDKFLKKLIPTSGPKMRELNFAGCRKLTNVSMKTIGENCSHLSSLDIRYLNRLNDSAIEHLANGGCPFQKLKLCHGAFSDEAIAAFLEASGATLVELVLNNIEKVAGNTAIAISRKCSLALRRLDLSFCRKLSDEALGLIVDSCLNLKLLKLFGCTQVTNVFLEGHSNTLVKIIGLKGSILEQVEMPDFT